MSEKTIYKTLAPFFDAVDGTEEKALKFTAPGYMDLCIEALGYNDHEGRPVYSVAHYGEQNGDLMRDPDVTMGVDREAGTVEPVPWSRLHTRTTTSAAIGKFTKTMWTGSQQNTTRP